MSDESVTGGFAEEPPVDPVEPYSGPSYTEITTPRDPLGRSSLRKITPLVLMWAMPWLLSGFDREVPAGMWSEDTEDGFLIALIPCPCGEEVKVRIARIQECSCGRFFFHAGQRVRVGGTDPQTAVSGRA